MSTIFAHKMGVEVRDKITGFHGRITSRIEHITGCNQYHIQPPVKDSGDYVEGHWIDEHRLEVLNTKPITLDRQPEQKPGACSTPPSLGVRR